ncbi:hypothetical protein [Glutamicibacter ardleyensis]|uniref:hypothetical protein n=1 Tax=Glutamicibacter ardleyensis TaxID=225894 RepID=UPI003FD681A9
MITQIEQLSCNDVADFLAVKLPEVRESDLPSIVFTAHIRWKQTHNGEPLLTDSRTYIENGHTRLIRMNDTRMKPDTDFMPQEVIEFLDSFVKLVKHQQVGV